MKINFIGTGEAWANPKENYQTCMFLEEGNANVLVECGYTAGIGFLEREEQIGRSPNYLDAVWVSHLHCDHFHGILPLIARMAKFDCHPELVYRTKPLLIMGPSGTEKEIRNYISSMHGKHILERETLGFDLNFKEFKEGDVYIHKDLELSFAEGIHSRQVLAVRVNSNKGSFAYSGDGAPTKATKQLYQGADFLVHEAYLLEHANPKFGHGTIKNLLKIFPELNVNKLAFVHINRYTRKNKKEYIDKIIKERRLEEKVIMPEDGDEFVF